MKKYFTYMHEHLRIDLSKEKNDADACFDDYDAICEEWSALQQIHNIRVVDVSCYGMGRDYLYIDRLVKDTSIDVVLATGFYKEPFFPKIVYQKSAKDISKIFIKDIEQGFENTNYKASLIGEIGSSLNKITTEEQNVFIASAIAHNETGVLISTHTTLGTMAIEQLHLLKEYSVDVSKIIFGHVALANNLDKVLQILDSGANLAFDTIGKIKYLPDETNVYFIQECIKRGHIEQIIMSVDITRKSHLKKYGGYGYSYLPNVFIPMLENSGVTKENIKKIMIDNPARLLGR